MSVGNKNHRPEQIIGKLREAKVDLAKGLKVPEVCQKVGVMEQTYFRWRKEYGGLRLYQVKRPNELERFSQTRGCDTIWRRQRA